MDTENSIMTDEEYKKFRIERRKEMAAEDGRLMYNEIWKDNTEEFESKVNECLKDTINRFSLGYVADVINDDCGNDVLAECQDKHHVIYLHGGQNGNGHWINYMKDMTNIVLNLCTKFDKVYLIKWNVDVADDVFDIWLGVK